MTPFSDALAALAALQPSGIAARFTVEDAPDQLSRVQLPALLVRLFDEQDRRLFRERGLKDAAILYMADPEVAQAAHAAGVGATITVDVGGKASPMQGEPVRMTLRVEAINDGVSRYDGPIDRKSTRLNSSH